MQDKFFLNDKIWSHVNLLNISLIKDVTSIKKDVTSIKKYVTSIKYVAFKKKKVFHINNEECHIKFVMSETKHAIST